MNEAMRQAVSRIGRNNGRSPKGDDWQVACMDAAIVLGTLVVLACWFLAAVRG